MKQQLIDYWSYSSMASLLNNPMAFKKTYILKQYDNQTSPSALIGSAGHKALELFHQGMSMEDAIAGGLKLINETSPMGINYGKTGTQEQIVAGYTQGVNFAFAELPTFHELLGVEESITVEIDSLTGGTMPLPAKAKMDIIARNKLGELEVHDWKFVKGYTDPDIDDFKKWLQGMFNYYVIKAKYGEPPARIVYQEIKTTKNRDNTPQRQSYTYEFASAADFATFEKLYNACTTQINLPGFQFLPNPQDFMNGQDTFEIYRQGIMGTEVPVVVPHKTEQVAFAEKRFVPSAQDQVGNEHLTMEERIRLKMQEFVGSVEVQDTFVGPSVTQYTLKVGRGIKMSKVAAMDRDLALALEAKSLRVIAPIPGTSLVGIEVPSAVRQTIELSDKHFHPGTLKLPIGVDVFNETIYGDLDAMPHLLVAGATGAGKSVFLNAVIKTLTAQLTPNQLQLLLVDPKQVEFAPFEGLPHLAQPVVYDNAGAARLLANTVTEMENRYNKLRNKGVRNIAEYNKAGGRMPYRVLILDEFADLMMTDESKAANFELNSKELVESIIDFSQQTYNLNEIEAHIPGRRLSRDKRAEDMKAIKQLRAMILASTESKDPPAEESIIRIAQKARAVGIHLILATQRPSADVVTGLIKANIPTKVAFMTTNRVNSQIILDEPGAEELTGKGDMLYADPGHALQRLQGLYA
jgi:hypothetical protein